MKAWTTWFGTTGPQKASGAPATPSHSSPCPPRSWCRWGWSISSGGPLRCHSPRLPGPPPAGLPHTAWGSRPGGAGWHWTGTRWGLHPGTWGAAVTDRRPGLHGHHVLLPDLALVTQQHARGLAEPLNRDVDDGVGWHGCGVDKDSGGRRAPAFIFIVPFFLFLCLEGKLFQFQDQINVYLDFFQHFYCFAFTFNFQSHLDIYWLIGQYNSICPELFIGWFIIRTLV